MGVISQKNNNFQRHYIIVITTKIYNKLMNKGFDRSADLMKFLLKMIINLSEMMNVYEL